MLRSTAEAVGLSAFFCFRALEGQSTRMASAIVPCGLDFLAPSISRIPSWGPKDLKIGPTLGRIILYCSEHEGVPCLFRAGKLREATTYGAS